MCRKLHGNQNNGPNKVEVAVGDEPCGPKRLGLTPDVTDLIGEGKGVVVVKYYWEAMRNGERGVKGSQRTTASEEQVLVERTGSREDADELRRWARILHITYT